MSYLNIFYGDKLRLNNRLIRITYCDVGHLVNKSKETYVIDSVTKEINGLSSVEIVKRNDKKGVVETNEWMLNDELELTNTQIGDVIRGTIIEIEKDMIILQTLFGIKYIDFAYKGIPPWLNIQVSKGLVIEKKPILTEIGIFVFDEINELDLTEVVEVGVRKHKLYSLEDQIYYLIESILFEIPKEKRNAKVIFNANYFGKQYKKLRESTFIFDSLGLIQGIKAFKPIEADTLPISFPTFIGSRLMSPDEGKMEEYLFKSKTPVFNSTRYFNQCFVRNDNGLVETNDNKIIHEIDFKKILFTSNTAVESLLSKDTSQLFAIPNKLLFLYNNTAFINKVFNSSKVIIPSFIIDKLKLWPVIPTELEGLTLRKVIENNLHSIGYSYCNVPYEIINQIRSSVEKNVALYKIELNVANNEVINEVIEVNNIEITNPLYYPLIAAKHNNNNTTTVEKDEFKKEENEEINNNSCDTFNWDECLVQKDCFNTKEKCLEDADIKRIIIGDFKKMGKDVVSEPDISKLKQENQRLNCEKNWLKKKRVKYLLQFPKTNANDKIMLVSPFLEERNNILNEKENDIRSQLILDFCNTKTRDASSSEDSNWLYCIETGNKLLPVFIKTFAQKFIIGVEEYELEVSRFIQMNGVYNDMNHTIVDIKTGFFIKNIEFIQENGYLGGELQVIDMDEQNSNKIIELLNNNPHLKTIYKTILSISSIIGVILSEAQQFVTLQIANQHFYSTYITETQYRQYKKAQERKGEKAREYEDMLGSFILFSSVSSLAVNILYAVPHIQVSRVVSGCLTFFSKEKIGNYLACVLKKMKQPNPVFNSISKTKESNIVDAINKTIDTMVLSEYAINLIKERELYDATNPEAFIIESNSTIGWDRFLPYKMNNNTQPTNNTAFNIQVYIHQIINLETPLLFTKSNKNFLENACCLDTYNQAMNTLIKLDGSKQRLAPLIKQVMESYPSNSYCCNHTIAPYFPIYRKKWINPTPPSMLEHTKLTPISVDISLNYPIKPISNMVAPKWVKEIYSYLENGDKFDNLMSVLKDNISKETDTLLSYFKIHNDFKSIDKLIVKWTKKDKIFTNDEIMLWKDIVPFCCKIIPITIVNSHHKLPSKITQIEKNGWKVKHWNLSQKNYEDIQQLLIKVILKFKNFYGKKTNSKMASIFELPMWKWVINTLKHINDPELVYLVSFNLCLDAFNKMAKMESTNTELIKAIMTTFIDIKKYILKNEKEINNQVFLMNQIEKNMLTDKLQSMTEEERQMDNYLKQFNLGDWGKGLEKGLRQYDKRFYDSERDFINAIRKSNIDPNDDESVENMLKNKLTDTIEDNEYADFSVLDEDWMNGEMSDDL